MTEDSQIDFGPRVYVPTTRGELSDYIGSLVLCLPDMEISNSGLDMAGAYRLLEHSLGLVRTKIGDERYHALIAMARQSHEHFQNDESKAGRRLLQDMGKLLRKPGKGL
jgi:hypothetical protein